VKWEKKIPITGSPEFANAHLFNPSTGVVKTAVRRYNEIRKVNLTIKLAKAQKSSYFNNFWLGGYGSAIGFRFRYVPDFTAIDEVFGEGDGLTTEFYLVKTYKRPGASIENVRRIIKPVVNAHLGGDGVTLYEPDGADPRVIPSSAAQNLGVPAFTIKVDGTPTTAYTIDNTIGKVTFTSAPGIGAVLTWSGEDDLPAAFVGNSYVHNFDTASEITGIALREILPAELDIYV
jgi:hypothetical protein